MHYRNKITGAEFESQCEITAPNWECVDEVKKVIPENQPSVNDTNTFSQKDEPAKVQAHLSRKEPVTKTKTPKKSPKKGARR